MDREIRANVIERTLTPLGWHLVGTANLDAAEHLVANDVNLAFDDPIRALYAHAWELNLKACLRRQGMTAESVRKEFGHDLIKIWDAVDRSQFPLLRLDDELRPYIEHTAHYHRNRLYVYPIRGFRKEYSLVYVRTTSSRLRLTRQDSVETFGSP